MSLYYSMLQLTPSMYLHLLCLLLLLTDSSYTVPTKKRAFLANPLTQVNTSGANCSTGCNNNNTVSQDSKAEDFSTISSTGKTTNPQQQRWSSIPDLLSNKLSVPVISTQPAFVEKENKDTVRLKVTSKGTQQVQSSPDSSSSINHTTASYKLRNSVASPILPKKSAAGLHSSTASTLNTSPERITWPASVLPSLITGLPTHSANTGSITITGTSTTTTAEPILDARTVGVLVASTSTTKPPSTVTPGTAPTFVTTTGPSHSETTVKETADTNIAITENTGLNMSPSTSGSRQHLSTGMPPFQTTSLTPNASSQTVTSTVTSTKHLASATRVAVVEVAGAALTSQLVDTSFLLAVLLFGLLFLLVTVAVLIKQAFESYRRKDYTQVDYLINGMYTDSGV